MTVPDDVRPAPDADSGGQTTEEETASSSSYEGSAGDQPGPGAAHDPAPNPPAESHSETASESRNDTAAEPPQETAEPLVDALPHDVTAPAEPPDIADAVTFDDQPAEASVPSSDAGWAEAMDELDPDQRDGPPDSVAALADVLDSVTSLGGKVDDLAAATAELARLRTRDTDLISRLHDDVTKLRTGELAAALNPVVFGMIKLHDQMVSLGALTDPSSPVGMLYTQLLQTMELTCGVRPFTPATGERFDPSRHTGTRRILTTDASADGTIADAIKAGFVRPDGSVVRVAEVEVHRLSV